MNPRLTELGWRIEALAVSPETISAPFTRLLKPVLRHLGWEPDIKMQATKALRQALKDQDENALKASSASHFDRAVDELESNLVAIERATVVNGQVMFAHAAWLRRAYEWLVFIEPHIEDATPPPGRGDIDPTRLAPPLQIHTKADEQPNPDAQLDSADQRRLVELQLFAIDEVTAAARAERRTLGRRRRLFEAARQLLLDASNTLPLESDGVEARTQAIATAITRINQAQAAGVQPDVELLHQARQAMRRNDLKRLRHALNSVYEAACDNDDLAYMKTMGRAFPSPVSPSPSSNENLPFPPPSGTILGPEALQAIQRGHERGRNQSYARENPIVAQALIDYYAPGQERAMAASAMFADGAFEVGASLSPIRVMERTMIARAVTHPTPELVLLPARGPRDVKDAVLRDPRTLLMDLAAGRLLARRYVGHTIEHQPKTVMQSEVRVYVLDGSGSMIGPRARMRDAILVAELATLARRTLKGGQTHRILLYYQYFNTTLEPMIRVDSASAAFESIEEIVATKRTGGTNIQAALRSSLTQIHKVQTDTDLIGAQIVLITDGQSPMDMDEIQRTRESLGDLPLGVSVIALGEENEVLRKMVANSRTKGERAFYHFISDTLLDWVETAPEQGPALHIPKVDSKSPPTAAELHAEYQDLVDDLLRLQRSREQDDLAHLTTARQKHRTAPNEPEAVEQEGPRAALEVLYQDRTALQRRFLRWFPTRSETSATAPTVPAEGTKERDDLDTVLTTLTTIAEVIELVEGSEAARQADAIDLLHRLLPATRLSPARYQEVLDHYAPALEPAIGLVHTCVRYGLRRRLVTDR